MKVEGFQDWYTSFIVGTPVFKITPIAPFQRFIKGNFQGKNDVIEEYLHVYCFLRDFSQKNKKIVLP